MTAFAFIFLVAIRHIWTVHAISITGPTTGYKTDTKSWPSRLEINDLSSSGPAWDLFILALRDMQHADSDAPLSYFQIASIHGWPTKPWDGVKGTGTNDTGGFCRHSSILFPIWHRPYLALFEQSLSIRALNIAATYPGDLRDTYQKAAETLRQPYWDFALNDFPDSVMQALLLIRSPRGLQYISNPLVSYKLPEDKLPGLFPTQGDSSLLLSTLNFTVRHYKDDQSNQTAVLESCRQNRSGWLINTYHLLTAKTNWSTFATTNPALNGTRSLENMHAEVHVAVGGQGLVDGHMTHFHLSAYDPLFWLLHANVDRLTCIWQTLWPDEYVESANSTQGSYYFPNGNMDNIDTGLFPFHRTTSGKFWTARSARNISSFAYTYPEFDGLGGNRMAARNLLRSRIESKYTLTDQPSA